MTIILLIVLYCFYSYYCRRDYVRENKKCLAIISCILIFISGLRHEGVGNDTLAYMMHYRDVSYTWQEIITQFIPHYLMPVDGAKDPGMDVFDKLLQTIGLNDRLYLIAVSAITISVIAILLYKFANNWQSVFLSYGFFVVFLFNYIPNSALRQSLAVACLCAAYYYLRKSKYIFLLLVLLASTFHKSSLVAIFLLPMCMYLNQKTIIRLSILAFAVFIALPSTVALYISGEGSLYSEYATGSFYNQTSKPFLFILVIALMYGLLLYLRKFSNDQSENNKLMLSVASLGFVFTPLIWADPSAIRLLAYFGLFLPISIGNNVKFIKNWRMIFVAIYIAFFINAFRTEDNYHFMWQEMRLHDRYSYVLPNDSKNISNKFA